MHKPKPRYGWDPGVCEKCGGLKNTLTLRFEGQSTTVYRYCNKCDVKQMTTTSVMTTQRLRGFEAATSWIDECIRVWE
jgi:hypothetical protein